MLKSLWTTGVENLTEEELDAIGEAICRFVTLPLNEDEDEAAPWLHRRSPTLPLDEDADGETGQGIDNAELLSTLQDGKSITSRVLKPVSARISKPASKERVRRRRTSDQQREAKHWGDKMGISRKPRAVEPQVSSFSYTRSFYYIYQAGEPVNLKDQLKASNQQVQSHRASIDLHREGAQHTTRSRMRAALESKPIAKRKAESPASSMLLKRSRRTLAQMATPHSKRKNERNSPRENRTRSGRVSKRPEKFGFD
ncbi:hypothetical protein MMC25_001703 [Agyrium rufum]|nr:hypothetical protein [Agyrium rufum]